MLKAPSQTCSLTQTNIRLSDNIGFGAKMSKKYMPNLFNSSSSRWADLVYYTH